MQPVFHVSVFSFSSNAGHETTGHKGRNENEPGLFSVASKPLLDNKYGKCPPISPRTYHTSYPVPVRRPALSDWASFRPRLTTTPLPFSWPSAPLIPGVGTRTPLVLCHARHTRKVKGRRAFAASLLNVGLALLNPLNRIRTLDIYSLNVWIARSQGSKHQRCAWRISPHRALTGIH